MMNEQHRKTLLWTLMVSETSHIFCCALPTVFSIASLLSGFGMMGAVPVGLIGLHDALHDYEIPMMVISAALLALSWGLYWYSQKIDCHDSGCVHPPCEPTKKKTRLFLVIATVLFCVNATIYVSLHQAHDKEHTAHAHDSH